MEILSLSSPVPLKGVFGRLSAFKVSDGLPEDKVEVKEE